MRNPRKLPWRENGVTSAAQQNSTDLINCHVASLRNSAGYWKFGLQKGPLETESTVGKGEWLSPENGAQLHSARVKIRDMGAQDLGVQPGILQQW